MSLGRHAAPAAIACTAVLAFICGLLLGGRYGGGNLGLQHQWHRQEQAVYGSPLQLQLPGGGRAEHSDKDSWLAGKPELHTPIKGTSKAESSSVEQGSSPPCVTRPSVGESITISFANADTVKDIGIGAGAGDIALRRVVQKTSSRRTAAQEDDGVAVDEGADAEKAKGAKFVELSKLQGAHEGSQESASGEQAASGEAVEKAASGEEGAGEEGEGAEEGGEEGEGEEGEGAEGGGEEGEGEEGEGEEGEGEEAEETQEQVERAISVMTLGSVAFQMSLFYLVNHRDEDIRRYAYGVIGETISIFCAVLTFNAAYSWIEETLIRLSESMQMVALAMMVVFFFIAMEASVMFSARVRGEKAQTHSKLHGRELHILKHVLNAKTFGAGAAQMCGAACIRGFGHLQFRAYNELGSVLLTMGVAVLALLFFLLMMWIATQARKAIIFWDGQVDETELTWVEVAEECENEVCGLCMGFLLATVCRVLLTDSLPYILLHGFEHSHNLEVAHARDILGLMITGCLCAAMTIGLVLTTFGSVDSAIDEDRVQSSMIARSILLTIKIVGFSFSWCLCFSMHLFAIHVAIFKEGIRLRLILAIVQSTMSFLVIAVLDFFSDMDCTGAAFDKAIVTLIETLGVAIGLSWEHAFHECVEITVEYMVADKALFKASNDPKFWSLLLSGIIVLMVLPAYRMYIVPTRYMLLEECEEKMRAQERRYRQSTLVRPGYAPVGGEITPSGCAEEQTYTFQKPGVMFDENGY